jgi:hypothetical protein
MGHKFYAERAGFKPVVPDRTRLRAGDWLVVSDQTGEHPIGLAAGQADPAHVFAGWHLLAYRTTPSCYYGGIAPIRGDREPRISVWVYRAARDFVPASACKCAMCRAARK